MSERDDGLDRLRALARQIADGEAARDQEIVRLRRTNNPVTGRPWTWEVIAEAADMSRQGTINLYNRAKGERAA
ncbi:hypothetical protein [Nocardia asiatica]|uniref:hypothetical protein n=1 Tax=Nocardia asiatica TaxID=209252 RepID=UPI002453CE02|nr:hypothetical protein [Nocardia asiatica]